MGARPQVVFERRAASRNHYLWQARSRYLTSTTYNDITPMLIDVEDPIRTILSEEVFSRYEFIKVYYSMKIVFYRATDPEETIEHWLTTPVGEMAEDDFSRHYNKAAAAFNRQVETFTKHGSNWAVGSISFLDINVGKYNPMQKRGSHTCAPNLPKCIIKRTTPVVDIPSSSSQADGNCFQRAVTAGAYVAFSENLQNFKLPKNLATIADWEKAWIDDPPPSPFAQPVFPESFTEEVSISDINEFEFHNPQYRVLVIGFDEGFYPMRTFKYRDEAYFDIDNDDIRVIVLLLYKKHYFLVRNFKRLLRTDEIGGNSYPCYFCLHQISGRDRFQEHLKQCSLHQSQRADLPPPGKVQKFNDYEKMEKRPWVIYADIEAYHDATGASTQDLDQHVPYAACFVVCISDELRTLLEHNIAWTAEHVPWFLKERKLRQCVVFSFYGPNCIDQFMRRLVSVVDTIYNANELLNVPYVMTSDWRDKLANAERCYMCGDAFDRTETANFRTRPVIDHNHFTGSIRGIAHACCNAKHYLIRKCVPVLFHNFKGYDAHHICKVAKFGDLECIDLQLMPIAQSAEKYISLDMSWVAGTYFNHMTGQETCIRVTIRFLDTFQFLPCGLGKLMDQLNDTEGAAGFTNFRSHFKAIPDDRFNLLLRKGVFPHAHITGFDVLESSGGFPDIEKCGSDLGAGSKCSQADYDFALYVWNQFQCSTLADYSKIYLLVDVLGLADVFEKFRRTSLDNHGLDPVHFYTSPGLCWVAALKRSRVELQLISNYTIYTLFEDGIRGGLCGLTMRHASADNPIVRKLEQDETSPPHTSVWLHLFDANGLYSWAMTQPLPYGDFEHITDAGEIAALFPPEDISKWPKDFGEKGYLLEVDLDYPTDLHNSTWSYPLAPAHEFITMEDLSLHQLQVFSAFAKTRTVGMEKKLLASQRDKKNYVVHYRTLKLWLQLGLKLTRVRSVVQFSQTPWLKEYIDMNIALRRASNTPFDKDFFKLCNNAVFGKTQEQKRNRRRLELATGENQMVKAVSKPQYSGSVIYSADLAGVFLRNKSVLLNQPIYVGFAVLELSKMLMYDFFYNVFQPAVKATGGGTELVYTDTDSLLVRSETNDIEAAFASIADEWLDTSNMPPENPLFSEKNKGIIGKFKEELDWRPIKEVVALKPKCYAIRLAGDPTDSLLKKRAKGVVKDVVKKTINFDDYKRTLDTWEPVQRKMTLIRSKEHQLYTVAQQKTCLSLFDNKRFWFSDNSSYPYGYYHIEAWKAQSAQARKEFIAESKLINRADKASVFRRPPKRRDDITKKLNNNDDDDADNPVVPKKRQRTMDDYFH